MGDAEEWVTVRAAPRRANVSHFRIHRLIAQGRLTAQPGGPRGRLVSLAAVQAVTAAMALPQPREPIVPPPGMDEYVTPSVAARTAGMQFGTVSRWGTLGKVGSRRGPYGQLVRLADALALAAQLPVRRVGGEAEE